jgi:tetrahydromethanopterin S-methyltransferase subunit E
MTHVFEPPLSIHLAVKFTIAREGYREMNTFLAKYVRPAVVITLLLTVLMDLWRAVCQCAGTQSRSGWAEIIASSVVLWFSLRERCKREPGQ